MAMRGCRTMLRWNTRPRRSTSPTRSLCSGAAGLRPPDGRPPLVLARDAGAPGGGFGFGADVGWSWSPASRRARSMAWRRRAAARSLRATKTPTYRLGDAVHAGAARTAQRTGAPRRAGPGGAHCRADCRQFARMVRGACWRRRAGPAAARRGIRLLAEAAPPLRIGAQRAQEVDLAEGRPVGVGEVVLRVGRLPQQEAGQADLPRGADDQVGVGHPGGVQVPGDLVGGQAGGRVHQLEALLGVLAEQAPDRLGDLLPAAVADRDVEPPAAVPTGALLGLAQPGTGPLRQLVELADRHDAVAVGAGVAGELQHLRLDDRQQLGQLVGVALQQVLGR